ncbi:MAG: PH domain-containing protein [Desulfurococcales archaeon]|nr:PH domain-containing protein [Desulfurococcales archaeon]
MPYNLVSEVRLRQGLLQRKLGLANIDVFTPAQGTVRPEVTLFQLPYEVGLEKISLLRRKVDILTTRERKIIEEEILEELRRIRRLLEERRFQSADSSRRH